MARLITRPHGRNSPLCCDQTRVRRLTGGYRTAL